MFEPETDSEQNDIDQEDNEEAIEQALTEEPEIVLSEEMDETADCTVDLKYEFYTQYRLLRKKISAFIRSRLKKDFVNILYISAENPPYEYIISLQKQYPDKSVSVVIPIFNIKNDYEKLNFNFEYFIQNRTYSASIYKIPFTRFNVVVYGIYTEEFSKIKDSSEIYNIKYLSHYMKIVRKLAAKLKPDIVHADSVPFLLGTELGIRPALRTSVKYLQTAYDFNFYHETEPFWAAINLADKRELKRISSDLYIKKQLAKLFNIKYTKKFNQFNNCINYMYANYDIYREKINQDEDTKDNILLRRLDERITQIFPNFVPKDFGGYNPMYYSLRRADVSIINSDSKQKPNWVDSLHHCVILNKKYDEIDSIHKPHHSYTIDNFREVRPLNKKYLVRELSEKRIETKFVDLNLFASDEVNISGYLDSFYRSPLLFIPLDEYVSDKDIRTVSISILKLFEMKKNIQVIYNYPKNLDADYLKTLFEFFESQHSLEGRWIAIEGQVNIPQFLSAADMILIPSSERMHVEQLIYSSLRYGCIPIVSGNGVCANIVNDIYSDLNSGFGFKAAKLNPNDDIDKERECYTNVIFDALNFYNNNAVSWNILIKNAMNYDTSWDFKTLETYNDIYEDIL